MALGFDFNGFSPSVVPLKLSLPGQRVLLIQPGDVFEDVEQQLAKKTHLELYFNRPVATEDMLFLDYFAQFAVTDNGAKRRRLPVVPYFTNLNFNNREQFALYCLLKVRPARNTDQLRSGFQTFEEAAVAIGVFQGLHSSIHHEILQEFVERALAPESFINYLCTVVVSDTTQFSALFADFWEFAVPHRHVRTPVSALNAIAKVLHRDAVDVKELLSNSSDFIQDLLSSLSEPSVSDFFAGSQVSTANHPSLDTPTTEQQHVIDTVVRRVANGTRLIYINGLAGTGKTFVLGHIVRELTNLGKRTVCSAFTGAAALLLPQGITCHRLFGLPSDDDSDKRISSISDNGLAAKILRALDVVVIDEISMLNNQFIDLIDTTLSRICNSQSFGGKVVIISGDVHQLAPIVRSSRVASAGHTIQASFATSPSFRHFFICSLTTPMRFIDDRWVPYVNDDVATGKGEYIESTVYGSSFTTLPHYVAHDTHCSSRHQEAFPLPTHLQLIAPHHSTVTKWNESQFHRYFGDDPTRTTYESYYTFPPEYRLSVMDPQVFDRGGVAQHRLALAVGCPVFIMRNLLVSQGLANGSQAFVTHLDTNTVTVSVSGKQFVIHRISFKLNVNGSSILRHQFPLAPGFAATISKSQGRSCDQLIVDLSQDVFTHGQLYVALTRCRSPTHLFVVSSSRKVLNIVFPDLIEAVRQATVR
jgi:DNA replication protein DnaC